MRATDDYSCALAHSSPSAAAYTPLAQKSFGRPSAALALDPGPSLPHTIEGGQTLEILKERANKLNEVADRLFVVVEKARSMGWSPRAHYMRPVYIQKLNKWRRAKVEAANADLAVQEVEAPVDPSWESRLRFAFLLWCRDNDGGLHSLHTENHQARNKRTFARVGRIYAPGRWAAAPGDEIINTSWYFGKAPWEQESDEAEEKLKQPVDYTASPICLDSSPRPQSSPLSSRAPAPSGSPKRHRDDDNADDGRPSSPKRPHLIDIVPISPPPPAPAVLPVGITSHPQPVVSIPSSAARPASVPPPSASPWVISRQKCHRKDDNEGAAQYSNKPNPKRIRISTPRQLRASSAPPILVPSSRPSSHPPVSTLSSGARCSSVPPPTPSPWVIAGPKRRRDDGDEGARRPSTPKRIRLSILRPQRAGSAPPVVVARTGDSSCGITGSSTTATTSSTTQTPTAAASPPPSQPSLSQSPLLSVNSSNSPPASG
ncbi:hypothetical protein IWX90DRAFT_264921 [Phyllosticta citrichinensis]|uniref:Uncharacterized protein n=1 Tax=Phyllosticta citrichinensis TaxID=1130410 RepID=A0ABR1XM80_9PEZI